MLSTSFILAAMMPVMALAAPIQAHTNLLPRDSNIHLPRSISDIFNDRPVNLPEYAVAPKEDTTLFGGVEEGHVEAPAHGKLARRSESFHIHTSVPVLDVLAEDEDIGVLLQRIVDSARGQSSHILAMRLVIVLLSIAIVGELWNLWRLRQLSIQRDEAIYRNWVSRPLYIIDEKEELV